MTARKPQRGDPRVTTALRMTPELHNKLARAASQRGLSVNFLACKAIEDFLPRLRPAKEFRQSLLAGEEGEL